MCKLSEETNWVVEIIDGEERGYKTEEEVKNTFITYFAGLFTSVHAGDIEQCLQPLERQVSNKMNEELLKPFVGEEIY